MILHFSILTLTQSFSSVFVRRLIVYLTLKHLSVTLSVLRLNTQPNAARRLKKKTELYCVRQDAKI
jgi:hypothetical protein